MSNLPTLGNIKEETNSYSDNAQLSKASENSQKIKVKGDDLTKINIYAYGVGHVLNDITASCWFNFLLYFLTGIVKISPEKAGLVMLSGQIADGLATPIVGILSDKTETRCGKRTPWYIGGSILVIISFSLIFQKCLICDKDNSSEVMQLIYYITLPSLFNIGWAAVQVSHMSLLPIISVNKKNKDSCVRLRTGFTFISQFLSLVISFFVFYIVKDPMTQYSLLSLLCVFFGVITTFLFLIYCREVILSKNIDSYIDEMKTSLMRINSGDFTQETILAGDITQEKLFGNDKNNTNEVINWKYWMKKLDFHAYMIVYMFVRLSINVTGAMIPYYLTNVLKFEEKETGTPIEISIVFLISMTGSVFNSMFLQEKVLVSKDRLVMIIWSGAFVCLGCLPIMFLTTDTRWIIYILSFIFGIGFSLGLWTASSLINDVVGSKGKQGAFVYGAYSFSDKMSCGIVLYLFTNYVIDKEDFLRFSTAFLPPISMFFGFLMVLIMRKINNKVDQNNEITRPKAVSVIDDARFTFIGTN